MEQLAKDLCARIKQLAKDLLGGRCFFFLEGGYKLEAVSNSYGDPLFENLLTIMVSCMMNHLLRCCFYPPRPMRTFVFFMNPKVDSGCTHSGTRRQKFFKLCKVGSIQFGSKGIPYINSYDGRTNRYPDPLIKLAVENNKIVDFIKFDVGNVVMVTGGRNTGRVGILKNREKHKGSFETVHIQDASGHEFATCLAYHWKGFKTVVVSSQR